MSLFGIGDEYKQLCGGASHPRLPPHQLGRSQSAREFGSRSQQSNSSNMGDCLNDTPRSNASRSSRREFRRKGELSARMNDGEDIREALTHHAHMPNIQPSLSARRLRSLSPRCPRSPNPSRQGDSDSEHGSMYRSVTAPNLAKLGLRDPSPRGSPGAERVRDLWCRAASPSPESKLFERRDSSPCPSLSPSPRPTGSTRSVRSIRSNASTGASWNPRAKPGSAASEMSRAMSARSCRSQHTAYSSRCAEDHLWRELFHDELDERKESRLRGSGKAIGNRGKASNGIPWRQIPAYDSAGRICETGDPEADRRTLIKASGMAEKRRAQFSPRLDHSMGVMDLITSSPHMEAKLGILSENCENRPPQPAKADSQARQAWLDVVKRRAEQRREENASLTKRPQPLNPTRYIPQRQVSSAASVTSATDTVATGATGRDSDHLHWSYRQQKRNDGLKYNSARGEAVKDTCPYQRDDSTGSGSKSMQVKTSRHITGAGAESGTGDQSFRQVPADTYHSNDAPARELHVVQAEQVVESRRDFQFAQDKAQCFEGPDSQGSGRPASARSWLNRSQSANNLASSWASSSVHCIRAQGDGGAHRARWK